MPSTLLVQNQLMTPASQVVPLEPNAGHPDYTKEGYFREGFQAEQL